MPDSHVAMRGHDMNHESTLHDFMIQCLQPALIRTSCGQIHWSTQELEILLESNTPISGMTYDQWLVFVPADEREFSRVRHRRASAGLKSTHQHVLITESGQKIIVKSHMIPLKGQSGDYVEWFILVPSEPESISEFTERKRPELVNLPLEDVRSTIMSLAHEFRTPMTGLIGFLQLLKDEVGNASPASEYAMYANKSAESLIQMMESSLEIASLQAGVVDNHPRFISLEKEIRPVLDTLWKEANKKDIYLQIHWPKDDHVFIDRAILSTIVRNLVDNAIKFTLIGGVTVKFKVTRSHFAFEVSDTGVGMDESSLPLVFTPYWQESQGISRRFRGVGIGLSIVRGYVDALKGTVRVKSIKNEGTIIKVEIPMVQQGDDIDILEFTQAKRILYVEDDPVIQMLSRRILKDFLVDTCFTAEEALERIKSVTYDAFILDIQLGKGMTGMQLCKKLREMPEYAKTPIAAATAMNYNVVSEDNVKLFSHYLPKPFNRDQMLDLITSMTAKKTKEA